MANYGEADMEYYLYQFHIVIVGEQGVGKSCILRRFTEAAFTTDAMSTVGVDFSSRMIVIDGHRLKLQLWDTAGQERFRTISRAYYRNAVGVLLVFDITNESSFQHIPEWLEDVKEYTHPRKPVFVLVGNKTDQHSDRQVFKTVAEKIASSNGIDYVETSAKTSKGIDDVFALLAKRIYEAVQDGRVKVEDGWQGVKRGDEVPAEIVHMSLRSRQQSISVKRQSNCCE